MKAMIIATAILTTGLAQAASLTAWPDQATCSARFTYFKVNEPDLEKAIQGENKDILINLKRGEYGRASARTTFDFPVAKTQIELDVSLSNYDNENKPIDEKRLSVGAKLIVDGKVAGVVSVLKEGKSTDKYIINGFSMTNPEEEMVNQFRFARKDKTLSFREAIKELFPDKEILSSDVYISCTATPFKRSPVEPKF